MFAYKPAKVSRNCPNGSKCNKYRRTRQRNWRMSRNILCIHTIDVSKKKIQADIKTNKVRNVSNLIVLTFTGRRDSLWQKCIHGFFPLLPIKKEFSWIYFLRYFIHFSEFRNLQLYCFFFQVFLLVHLFVLLDAFPSHFSVQCWHRSNLFYYLVFIFILLSGLTR